MICGGYFEVDSKLEEINKLEELSNSSSFWDDSEKAQGIIAK